MRSISLLFLAAFTAWAVSVVSRDMATRKIPNSSIKTGLKLLGAGLAALGLYTWLGYSGRSADFLLLGFYPLFCLHLAWTVLAGVILWYAEIWPAGDAKFYILVSAALPLVNPQLRNFPGYLFLTLLINIFVAASLWAVGSYVASGFYSASPSDFFAEIWRDLKARLSDLNAGGRGVSAAAAYALNLGFLFLLQQVLSMEARGLVSKFFSRADILFFFIFILWDKIGNVFRSRRWVYVSTACYLLYFFLGFFLFRERLWLLLGGAAHNVLRFSLLLFFGRFMLEFLMEKKDTRYLSAGEVEPGIVLSAKAARMLKSNTAMEGVFDDCFRDGVTEEQAAALKSWLGKVNAPDPKVETVVGRPFALWIFSGAVISLLLNRNLAGLLNK
jgi:hypothetical protein